jgi:acetyl esterase/lipase
MLDALWSLRGQDHFESLRPTEADVRYRTNGPTRGVPPLLDVYLPARGDPRRGPSVVLIHGGGFVIGSRRMKPMRFLTTRLVAAGIAVCCADYRLIFRGGRIEESLDDVRDAIAFWRRRLQDHGLDGEGVSLVGLSAGATLALLVAPTVGPVRAIGSCFGLYEADHLSGPLASVLPRLLFRSRDRAAWASRSPRGAAQPEAPTLLIHGADDGLVPVEQAHRLAAHRESLGRPTRLLVYPGAPHGFFNHPCDAAEQATAALIAMARG